MPRVLPALVALLVLALPGVAGAQATNAPPGNSAIDEYLETVPGASGDQRPRKRERSPGSVLTPAERARLERLGPDGSAVANATEATAPAPARGAERAAKPSAGTSGKEGVDSRGESRSPLSAVVDAAKGSDGGGGMGVLLPVILLASLLGVVLLLALRRRSAS